MFDKSSIEVSNIFKTIKDFDGRNGFFYLAMLERLILSIVIDADRIDTETFMDNKEYKINNSNQKLFKELLDNLNNNINNFKNDTDISKARREISNICFDFADNKTGIYRLNIPTGGGKTLSSLRYALNHAQKYNKQHIFYIAPFMSILEQNSSEIRKFINNDDVVLEHHSNIVFDEDDEENLMEEKKYKLLTENWNSPIIATTMVQFLNTLFLHKTSSIRRMNSLCNSVIIIDEIQALPKKCTYLFTLVCNFLSKLCNSTIILCSATQPTFEKFDDKKIFLSDTPNIVEDKILKQYSNIFKRTTVIDKRTQSGYSTEEISEFIKDKIKCNNSLLMVVNTKKMAFQIYQTLKNKKEFNDISIYHLSTNMCPAHRIKVISALKEKLKRKEKVLCITTQLIEAGVDISFECVIRSLSGIDNIAQAAGRCNRNNEYKELKKVYIVNLKEENVGKLEDIKNAQNSATPFLEEFKQCPKEFDDDLLSPVLINKYFEYLYKNGSKQLLYYPIKNLACNMVTLLSNNINGIEAYKKRYGKDISNIMKQAFKTAGEYFNVIDSNQIGVVVYYDKSEELILKLNSNISYEEKNRCIKLLQKYTVNLYQNDLNKVKDYISEQFGVRILQKECYDNEIGFITEAKQKETLII